MTTLGTSLLLLTLVGAPPQTGGREVATVESAAEALRALEAIPLKGIPPALLQDSQGVAIIPNVVKAGLLIDGRFGRGVVLLRQPDGSWSNPLFLAFLGGGFGFQVGIQSTDVVLVFKTKNSLERFLRGKGKLTLGGDVAVAAGPVGRQAEAATDGQLKAEIYSYSRSRGLFAGVSLEGSVLRVDAEANEELYGARGGRPSDFLALREVPFAVASLKEQLCKLAPPPALPSILFPPQTPPPPGR
jgi:lipid-binding SYLF domain-containing protein